MLPLLDLSLHTSATDVLTTEWLECVFPLRISFALLESIYTFNKVCMLFLVIMSSKAIFTSIKDQSLYMAHFDLHILKPDVLVVCNHACYLLQMKISLHQSSSQRVI